MVLKDIFNSVPIGMIRISEQYEIVDGNKRIFAINSFLDEKIKYLIFIKKYYFFFLKKLHIIIVNNFNEPKGEKLKI